MVNSAHSGPRGNASYVPYSQLLDPKNGFVHPDKTIRFHIKYTYSPIKISNTVYEIEKLGDDGSDEEGLDEFLEREEEYQELAGLESGFDIVPGATLNLSEEEKQRIIELRIKKLKREIARTASPLHFAAKADIPGIMAALVSHPEGRRFANAMDLSLTPLQVLFYFLI